MGATGSIAQMALDERREHPMRVSVPSLDERIAAEAWLADGYVLGPTIWIELVEPCSRAVVPVASFFPGEVRGW